MFTDLPNEGGLWLFFCHTSQTYFTPSSSFPITYILPYTSLSLSQIYSMLLKFINAMAIECITNIPSMPHPPKEEHNEQQKQLVFDASVLKHQQHIPEQFIWPDEEKPCANAPELEVPLIDLKGFLSGDPTAAMEASRLVGKACVKHGFFLVVNHGVDDKLIADAHQYIDHFFELPMLAKQRAQRKVGEHCGYASSFTGRFSNKLPWKETLSFRYSAQPNSSDIVQDYLSNTMGEDFKPFGYI